MGRKQGQATAFTVVITPGEARVRKAQPPVGKPMADRRRKAPRRKPDFLAPEFRADK